MEYLKAYKSFKATIGVVVIGRNEGKRLCRCLQSVLEQTKQVVYVDSGSSDNSVSNARCKGIAIVQLDMTIPFSAGRARNAGFEELLQLYPYVEFVQFIDGDCDLCGQWLKVAHSFLTQNPFRAIAAGNRKEKFPEKSIYNLLCDIEWSAPIGKTKSCGGDFMIRVSAFRQVGGFNPYVIAGEEPELCYRLSSFGWAIHRLNQPMTMHDASIYYFTQWWKRAQRTGHAYAQGYFLHRKDGKGYYRGEYMKILWWAFFFPTAVFTLGVTVTPFFLLFFVAYPLQFLKIALSINSQLMNWRKSLLYALFTVVAKWPQLIGQFIFLKRIITDRELTILEYQQK